MTSLMILWGEIKRGESGSNATDDKRAPRAATRVPGRGTAHAVYSCTCRAAVSTPSTAVPTRLRLPRRPAPPRPAPSATPRRRPRYGFVDDRPGAHTSDDGPTLLVLVTCVGILLSTCVLVTCTSRIARPSSADPPPFTRCPTWRDHPGAAWASCQMVPSSLPSRMAWRSRTPPAAPAAPCRARRGIAASSPRTCEKASAVMSKTSPGCAGESGRRRTRRPSRAVRALRPAWVGARRWSCPP